MHTGGSSRADVCYANSFFHGCEALGEAFKKLTVEMNGVIVHVLLT